MAGFKRTKLSCYSRIAFWRNHAICVPRLIFRSLHLFYERLTRYPMRSNISPRFLFSAEAADIFPLRARHRRFSVGQDTYGTRPLIIEAHPRPDIIHPAFRPFALHDDNLVSLERLSLSLSLFFSFWALCSLFLSGSRYFTRVTFDFLTASLEFRVRRLSHISRSVHRAGILCSRCAPQCDTTTESAPRSSRLSSCRDAMGRFFFFTFFSLYDEYHLLVAKRRETAASTATCRLFV